MDPRSYTSAVLQRKSKCWKGLRPVVQVAAKGNFATASAAAGELAGLKSLAVAAIPASSSREEVACQLCTSAPSSLKVGGPCWPLSPPQASAKS